LGRSIIIGVCSVNSKKPFGKHRGLVYSIGMSTLTLEVPELSDAERSEVIRMIAAKLYERGTLSLGQAAKMAGMKKWDFARILGDFDVNYFSITPDELAREVRNG
jgi:predicted HTH domain antitoxin